MNPKYYQQKRSLINEIEALRAIKGQRIFELYEIHETERNIILVTEVILEDSLQDLLQGLDLLSKSTIQQIMFNILKSLSIFSSHGIIHRNIKPSNILVEDDLKIKIVNFGLAISNSALVTTVKICGTPGYIAPEVFKWGKAGAIYNEKCDVFAAGCVFFEMLFGYPLFEELFFRISPFRSSNTRSN